MPSSRRLFLSALWGGWGLAALFFTLWITQWRGRESAPGMGDPPARRAARQDSREFRSASPNEDRKLPELGSRPASGNPLPEPGAQTGRPGHESAPSGRFFEIDAAGRIQFAEGAIRSLGLPEADATTVLASTQVYLDMYAGLQKRHLDLRKFEPDQIEFSIEAFPSEGREIRDGVSSVWLRYLDPAAYAGIKDQIESLFGGGKEGFGALRVVAKAQRLLDGEGSVMTTEQFYTPSGEKAGYSTGVSIGENDAPISGRFPRFSHLFEKP